MLNSLFSYLTDKMKVILLSKNSLETTRTIQEVIGIIAEIKTHILPSKILWTESHENCFCNSYFTYRFRSTSTYYLQLLPIWAIPQTGCGWPTALCIHALCLTKRYVQY